MRSINQGNQFGNQLALKHSYNLIEQQCFWAQLYQRQKDFSPDRKEGKCFFINYYSCIVTTNNKKHKSGKHQNLFQLQGFWKAYKYVHQIIVFSLKFFSWSWRDSSAGKRTGYFLKVPGSIPSTPLSIDLVPESLLPSSGLCTIYMQCTTYIQHNIHTCKIKLK